MTCKRIAKLLSERQDRELPWSRRLAIRIHLSWCVFCRRLESHLELIRGVSMIMGSPAAVEENRAFQPTLSPEAKSRIKRALSQKY